jgi:NAD(P)-dependent dehydrogenase (short-subunit alcohol dehydrogenase family)
MKIHLKKLNEQVVVITGASSGIGRATAQMAAERGARLVLNSRDETDLGAAAEEIRSRGGQVSIVVGDVADGDAMLRLAEAAIRDFGRIDTWVNNAGVSIYGRIEDVTLDDARRLFETNYWGVVHGSLAALPHLKRNGGALINVGSILSDTGYPLQGHYAASKHAVKGFTDSLRIELEYERAPVAVTLIQPAAIDTPYPEHAGNYLAVEPQHLPPVYAPELVAETILKCAEKPHRDVLVGGGGKMFQSMEHWAPALGDRFKAGPGVERQLTDEPAHDDSTLYAPRVGDARIRGRYRGHVAQSSAYTSTALNPGQTLAAVAAIGAAVALASRTRLFNRNRGRIDGRDWESQGGDWESSRSSAQLADTQVIDTQLAGRR